MRRFLVVLLGLTTLLAGLPLAAEAAPAPANNCQFVLGFKTLHDMIPNIVGDCVTNEQHAANGDSLQQTTKGLLVWRKADNFTAFTDGFRTWVNGPLGLQERLNSQRFDWEKMATVPSTQVINFVPPTTTSNQVSGSCFASSLAATRSDAWRCMAGNVIYDPCFSIPNNSNQLVCVRDPRDPSTFVTMTLTKALPAPEPVPAEKHPWFVQLADGSVCNFFTGATGAVNGERINYGCSDGWDIVGEPQTGTVWTAQQVLLAPMSTTVQKSAKVELAKVWE
ncbi:MAG TPA: hypothetical protein VFZ25_00165 [Chloroflexota bacterium]|nr:hypothetical protein [Chloroflexota bacterium]